MILTRREQWVYDCVMQSHIARTVAESKAKKFKISIEMAAMHTGNMSDADIKLEYQEVMSEHALVQFAMMNNGMSRVKVS